MSSEDTELTFVRCPSCRSLVPAVATRCRMCGHQFSIESESAEVESIETESSQFSQADTTSRKTIIEEPVIEKAPNIEPVEFNEAESFEEKADFDSFRTERTRKGSSNGLNFKPIESKRVEEPVTEPVVEPVLEPVLEPRATREEKFEESNDYTEDDSESFVQKESRQELSPENKKRKRRRKRKKKAPESVELTSDEQESSERKPKQERVRSVKVEKSASSGVLVGWLVSYSNDINGFSIELRTGKFFVAKQKLREDDLIIPDSAISTPHCLLKVNKGSLQIQDLMSEQGTFVKKGGTSEFVSSDEVDVVEHGDSLKFGAFELLVCLVPDS